MTPALLLLLTVAQSTEPTATDATQAPPIGPKRATVRVDREALSPALTQLTQVDPSALHLDRCVAGPRHASPSATTQVQTGAARLQVVLRRGQVKVVTTTSISEGLEWMAPCLERQLAEWSWPVKRGRFAVPLTVEPTGD